MRKHAGVALAFALFFPRWCGSDGKMVSGQSRAGETDGNIAKIFPVSILMLQVE